MKRSEADAEGESPMAEKEEMGTGEGEEELQG